jgi:hypothetical protein
VNADGKRMEIYDALDEVFDEVAVVQESRFQAFLGDASGTIATMYAQIYMKSGDHGEFSRKTPVGCIVSVLNPKLCCLLGIIRTDLLGELLAYSQELRVEPVEDLEASVTPFGIRPTCLECGLSIA